jgi:hypothetical protein
MTPGRLRLRRTYVFYDEVGVAAQGNLNDLLGKVPHGNDDLRRLRQPELEVQEQLQKLRAFFRL